MRYRRHRNLYPLHCPQCKEIVKHYPSEKFLTIGKPRTVCSRCGFGFANHHVRECIHVNRKDLLRMMMDIVLPLSIGVIVLALGLGQLARSLDARYFLPAFLLILILGMAALIFGYRMRLDSEVRESVVRLEDPEYRRQLIARTRDLTEEYAEDNMEIVYRSKWR